MTRAAMAHGQHDKTLADDAAGLRVVGLRYAADDDLPRVILKGAGPLAQQMLSHYSRPALPVMRNEALLSALYRLPVDAAIGPELFQAVAVLLAHVFALDSRKRGAADE